MGDSNGKAGTPVVCRPALGELVDATLEGGRVVRVPVFGVREDGPPGRPPAIEVAINTPLGRRYETIPPSHWRPVVATFTREI